MPYDPAFQAAIARVLDHEGGYVNNKADPGRETNWGISKRAYPSLNIKALKREDAVAIYYRDYWQKLPPGLPAALAPDMLDIAVNSGPKRAVILLQQAMDSSPTDGTWDACETAALAKWEGREAALLARLNGARLRYMASLPVWDKFSEGWANRVAANLMAVT